MLNDSELLTLLLYGDDGFNEASNNNILFTTIFYNNSDYGHLIYQVPEEDDGSKSYVMRKLE